jgi:hypothetical protein
MLSVVHAKCRKKHYADCHCADCHYADCHYAECHYAECYYAEGHFAESQYAECRYAECHYTDCDGARHFTFLYTYFEIAEILERLFLKTELNSSYKVTNVGPAGTVVEPSTHNSSINASNPATGTGSLYYKTFYGRNCCSIIISLGVCHCHLLSP